MMYDCSYMPQMEGEHRVIIKWSDKEIAKSPFKVLVEGAAGDASKVTAAGPGLEKTGVSVSKKTYFEVYTKGRFHSRNNSYYIHLTLYHYQSLRSSPAVFFRMHQ